MPAPDFLLEPIASYGGTVAVLSKQVRGTSTLLPQGVLEAELNTLDYDWDFYQKQGEQHLVFLSTTGLAEGLSEQQVLALLEASYPPTAPAPAPNPTSTGGLTPDQQAAINQVTAPVAALVGGVVKGYATVAAAIAALATVIHLKAPAVFSTPAGGPIFYGVLYGNGYELTITNGAVLRVLRYLKVYNCTISAVGTGNVQVIASGTSAPDLVPAPNECMQAFNSTLNAPLNFAPVSNYQGLALFGNSTAANLASGGGPLYLYDAAEVMQPLPPGFTLYDKRPGMGLKIRIATTSTQQNSLTQNTSNVVPFSVVQRNNGSAGVVDLVNHALVIPRACEASVDLIIALKDCIVNGYYQVALLVNSTDGTSRLILNDLMASADSNGGGVLAMYTSSVSEIFAAGDVLMASIYAGSPGAYRGGTQVSTLTFSEK